MNNVKAPITIGMGWDFFTSEEKQVLCAELNRYSKSPQIELATLPFVKVDNFFVKVIPIWINHPSLTKKLLALKTGHIDKMRRLG